MSPSIASCVLAMGHCGGCAKCTFALTAAPILQISLLCVVLLHLALSRKFCYVFGQLLLDVSFHLFKTHVLGFSTYFVSDFTHHFDSVKCFLFFSRLHN